MNLRVRKRGGFSDREGIAPISREMQYNDLNEPTRIKILNIINKLYDGLKGRPEGIKKEYIVTDLQETFAKFIYSEAYVTEVSGEYMYCFEIIDTIRETVLQSDYAQVFDLLEVIVIFRDYVYEDYVDSITITFNELFEEEYVGYRFVRGQITPITNQNEIECINEAMDSGYRSVNEHLGKAVSLLSDREKPDYENSIKESISAVEAICSILIGKGTTLGEALKQLEKNGLIMHGSLKSAFSKLYGYTSDASGIRHAGGLGGEKSTFEEAKFMLISCSAFVNYLIGVSSKMSDEVE